MKCGMCETPIALISSVTTVQFRLDNGRLAWVHFCSVLCAYQGGLAHARAMTTTNLTIGQLQVVFGEMVEHEQ